MAIESKATKGRTMIRKQTVSPKWHENFIVGLSDKPTDDIVSVFVW